MAYHVHPHPSATAFPERTTPARPVRQEKVQGADLFIAPCTHQNILASYGGNR